MFTSPFDEKKSIASNQLSGRTGKFGRRSRTITLRLCGRTKKIKKNACGFTFIDYICPQNLVNLPRSLLNMCLNPLRRSNPHISAHYESLATHRVVDHKTGEISRRANVDIRFKDSYSFRDNHESVFLNIPCGHCSECVAVKQQSFVQRVFMETKYNHVFFATLTYDNKHLPSTDVFLPKDPKSFYARLEQEVIWDPYRTLASFEGVACTPGIGPDDTHSFSSLDLSADLELTRIPYADIHDLQLLFKRMRDNDQTGRGFRYLAVTERGKKRARPHCHIMFFIPKRPGDTVAVCEDLNLKLKDMLLRYWSRNVGTRKNPIYERLFTYKERWINGKLYRNFDCHYVNPILTTEGVNNVTFYVTKYIFKESKKEEELRKMLFARLAHTSEDSGELDLREFLSVWDVVRSRMVCSKGLGLDAGFETLPKVREVYEHGQAHQEWYTARILVPNFDLVQQIKDNAKKELNHGRFVFVNYNGEHFTLAKYYQDRCLTEYDFVELYYETDPHYYTDPYRADKLSKHERDKKARKYARQCKMIDDHEIVDSRWDEIERGRSIDPYAPGSYRTPGFLQTLTTPVKKLG